MAESLQSKIADVLVKWPLYRTFRHDAPIESKNFPFQITLWCPKCEHEQNWSKIEGYFVPNPPGAEKFLQYPPIEPGHNQARFSCRNCGAAIAYFFRWVTIGKEALFTKVGQYPPQEVDPPAQVSKHLDPDDLQLYKRALNSRNFAYGLGALSYLRRVVENRMNDLLDLISKAAQTSSGIDSAKLAELEKVKTSWRFDDKITFAAGILPAHLRPGNSNPIDRLHDLASDGIHSRSEEECLEIFDVCKDIFEYLFTQLRVSLDEAAAFVEAMKKGEEVKASTKKRQAATEEPATHPQISD